MISLVIVIVVTILLVAIATTAGFRYLEEANKLKGDALSRIIGNAAYQRQNDLSSGVASRYYDGYVFNVDMLKDINVYNQIKGLPTISPSDAPNISSIISELFEKDGANWYIIDSNSANDLGATDAEELLTKNVTYIPADNNDAVKVVLVDYTNGDAYYVSIPTTIADQIIKKNDDGSSGCPSSPNGQHRYTIATCTEPSVCIYCEEVHQPALGHDWVDPTCTSAQYCRRCGTIGRPALGHAYIRNDEISSFTTDMTARNLIMYTSTGEYAWITDAVKHWHECKRCSARIEEGEHEKHAAEVPGGVYHQEICVECGWESVQAKHNLVITTIQNSAGDPSSPHANAYDNQHQVSCTVCTYKATHNDSGWIVGNDLYHYRQCLVSDECNTHTITLQNGKLHGSNTLVSDTEVKAVFIEGHYDENKDYMCDVVSCQRYTDTIPPKPFGIGDDTYGRVTSTTTHSISVEAFTTDDELGVDHYVFGIKYPNTSGETNEIEWRDSEPVFPVNKNDPVTYTFDGLKPPSANFTGKYTIYVKAYDKNGNSNTPYPIEGKTKPFPTFPGIDNEPDTVVAGPIEIGIKEIVTDLPSNDLYLQYSKDDGATWTFININDVPTTKITITEPNEKIIFRFVDYGNVSDAQAPKRNFSQEYPYTINAIDKTEPEVEILSGDYTTPKAQYYATIKITDPVVGNIHSGIAPNTEVKYGWSTSPTTRPSNIITTHTKNIDVAYNVTFEVPTPEATADKYYLWVMEGIEDAVGNKTTHNKISEFYFNVDDIPAKLINISMKNDTPAVENENFFVKTGGTVTIRFTANKELGRNPVVKLNDRDVTNITTTDYINYVCSMIIDSSFEEGTLQLKINNVMSGTGKLDEKLYTNTDLNEGPVIYDKTDPTLEYIEKRA